jgi:hypothetical protein
LSAFLGPDLKPDLFKILISLIASDRVDVLIEVIKLLIVALGNDPEQEGVALRGYFQDIVIEVDRDINFLNRSGEKRGLTKLNGLPVGVDVMAGLRLGLWLDLLELLFRGLLDFRFGFGLLLGLLGLLGGFLLFTRLF